MATQYFSLPYSYEQIAKVSQYKRKGGVTDLGLVDTVKKLGLVVRGKGDATWANLRRLNSKNNVIIVSWMKYGYMGHFSVVDTVEKDHIILADPEFGTLDKIEKIVFMRLWMSYDDMWYPIKNTDIQLRWMTVVSVKRKKTRSK